MDELKRLIELEDIGMIMAVIKKTPELAEGGGNQIEILEAARGTGVVFFKNLCERLNIKYENVLLFKKNKKEKEKNIETYLEYYARGHFLAPRYVAISGKIGAGKSTAAGIIVDYLKARASGEEVKKGVQRISFARKIKDVAAYICNTPIETQNTQEGKNKMDILTGITYGELQQRIGTMFRENISPTFWIDVLFASLEPEDNFYIIDDLRFRNEAAAIKERGGILIRINGDPAGVNAASKRDKNHPSEVDLDNYEGWDLVINNDSDIEGLREKLVEFLGQLF